MTKEPPKGLRANLTGSYLNVTDEFFAGSSKPEQLSKLFLSLAFFHAIIQVPRARARRRAH